MFLIKLSHILLISIGTLVCLARQVEPSRGAAIKLSPTPMLAINFCPDIEQLVSNPATFFSAMKTSFIHLHYVLTSGNYCNKVFRTAEQAIIDSKVDKLGFIRVRIVR
jgi:hypothetical protein